VEEFEQNSGKVSDPETVGLHRAIDNNFKRLVENARVQWERNFAGKDPSDACVTVRVTTSETPVERPPVPGSGFVKSSKKFEQRSNISLPRYAQ
jgi:hypothetical protein